MEYASIFTALGVEVTLVDSGERILSFLDAEISSSSRRSSPAWGCGSCSAVAERQSGATTMD